MKQTLFALLASVALAAGAAAALAQDQQAQAPAPAGNTPAAGQPAAAAKPEAVGTPSILDAIAIRVGSEIITTTEIEEPLRQLRERLAQQFKGSDLEQKMKQARQEHVKRLTEEKLLLLEAKAQNIEVTQAQVDDRTKQEMDALRAQFPTQQDFENQLASEHLTLEDLREQRAALTKENILRQKLLQGKFQEFSNGGEITDAQLSAYFDKHRDEFRRPPRVNLSQIFVARPDAGLPAAVFDKQDKQARAKIEQALADLHSGADFNVVARKYSEHRATAEKGGEVGWISQGETGMPDFDKEVFGRLKVGQISPVIATGRGYFVVRVSDRQDGGTTPFEEVKGRIRQLLMSQGSDARYQAWIETLKTKYPVAETAKNKI
jgi:parvulin-like peptidyl-prolyl isomerase